MNTRAQSVKALAARLVKENLVDTIKSMSVPLDTDVWIYRMVVAVLGLAVLACITGAIVLSMENKPIPDFLVALVSAAVGGLTGLLVPSPRRKQ